MQDPTNFWNARYGEAGFAYGTTANDFVVETATRIPEGPVLCLAEGEGRNAVYLASRGHEVTAMDLSAVGLEKAQALAKERGVALHTMAADLAGYVIEEGRWSAIVCIWMHLPQPLRARVLAAAARGLKPGGVLIIESYAPAQLAFNTGGPRDVGMLVALDDLRSELAGLSLDVFEEIERDVHEGPYHEGKSAVVRAVARRA